MTNIVQIVGFKALICLFFNNLKHALFLFFDNLIIAVLCLCKCVCPCWHHLIKTTADVYVMTHTYNLSTQKAESEGLPWMKGQPGLHSDILPQR